MSSERDKLTPAHSFSPSEISQWRECNRKWAWKYLQRNPGKRKGGARELGDAIHLLAEKYLAEGTPPDLSLTMEVPGRGVVRPGLILQAGLHLLPQPPQPIANLENKFNFEAFGYGWKGRVDLFVKGPGPWLCYDHKTTSDFRYVKTPEDLASDPQGVIYATYALLESGHDEVDLAWIYYRTKKTPDARRVRLRVLKDDVIPHWVGLKETADEIAAARERRDPENEQKNLLACGDFGGCDYAEECIMGRSFDEMVEERIKNRLDSAPAVPRDSAPAAPPPPPPDEEPPPPPPEDEAPIDPTKPVIKVPQERDRASVKAECVRLGLVTESSKLGLKALMELLDAHDPPADEDKDAIFEPRSTANEIPPPPAPVFEEEVSPPAPVPGGFTLYIDCMPVYGTNEEIVHATKFMEHVYQIAAESVNLPNYRMADYGKGPGVFAACLEKFLQANRDKLDGKAMVISSAGNSDAIPTLENWATRIVRGIR